MMYNSLPYIFFLILYSNFLSLCPRAFEDFSNSICENYWGSNVNANIEGNFPKASTLESVFSARFIMLRVDIKGVMMNVFQYAAMVHSLQMVSVLVSAVQVLNGTVHVA